SSSLPYGLVARRRPPADVLAGGRFFVLRAPLPPRPAGARPGRCGIRPSLIKTGFGRRLPSRIRLRGMRRAKPFPYLERSPELPIPQRPRRSGAQGAGDRPRLVIRLGQPARLALDLPGPRPGALGGALSALARPQFHPCRGVRAPVRGPLRRLRREHRPDDEPRARLPYGAPVRAGRPGQLARPPPAPAVRDRRPLRPAPGRARSRELPLPRDPGHRLAEGVPAPALAVRSPVAAERCRPDADRGDRPVARRGRDRPVLPACRKRRDPRSAGDRARPSRVRRGGQGPPGPAIPRAAAPRGPRPRAVRLALSPGSRLQARDRPAGPSLPEPAAPARGARRAVRSRPGSDHDRLRSRLFEPQPLHGQLRPGVRPDADAGPTDPRLGPPPGLDRALRSGDFGASPLRRESPPGLARAPVVGRARRESRGPRRPNPVAAKDAGAESGVPRGCAGLVAPAASLFRLRRTSTPSLSEERSPRWAPAGCRGAPVPESWERGLRRRVSMRALRVSSPFLALQLLGFVAAAASFAQTAPEPPASIAAFVRSDPRLDPREAIQPLGETGAPLSAGFAAAWNAFLLDHGEWSAFVDARNGRVESAEGAGIPWIPGAGNRLTKDDLEVPLGAKAEPDLALLEAIARKFVAGNAELFGVEGKELRLAPGRSGHVSDALWLVDFDVVRGGLAIEGARLVFRVGHGNLIQLGSERLPPPDAAAPPVKVTREGAHAALAAFLGGFDPLADRFIDSGSIHLLPVAVADDRFADGFAFGKGYGLLAVWEISFRRDGVIGT